MHRHLLPFLTMELQTIYRVKCIPDPKFTRILEGIEGGLIYKRSDSRIK